MKVVILLEGADRYKHSIALERKGDVIMELNGITYDLLQWLPRAIWSRGIGFTLLILLLLGYFLFLYTKSEKINEEMKKRETHSWQNWSMIWFSIAWAFAGIMYVFDKIGVSEGLQRDMGNECISVIEAVLILIGVICTVCDSGKAWLNCSIARFTVCSLAYFVAVVVSSIILLFVFLMLLKGVAMLGIADYIGEVLEDVE